MSLHDRPHYVYRYFDAQGQVLYIGCTSDPRRRMAGHASRSEWFPLVADYEQCKYEDYSEATLVEARAIIREQPLYNRSLNSQARKSRAGAA